MTYSFKKNIFFLILTFSKIRYAISCYNASSICAKKCAILVNVANALKRAFNFVNAKKFEKKLHALKQPGVANK